VGIRLLLKSFVSLTRTATSDLNIENTNIKTADGVSLDEQQKTLVRSVLDVSHIQSQFLAFADFRTAFRGSSIFEEAPAMGG